ncbi:hypothetical protein H7X46_05685 [Pseudonocardia sp. C8]|uniref:hypothetical protein n=1 Tax=Pseudonocardia sp. C8 TaxID=2762759 RepID=UPI00164259D4|nr:hypothetical protein [Pseudonocardia sp. C8]MBC3190554.1 hypothetical protein [Pseudonocardia sp. C8]
MAENDGLAEDIRDDETTRAGRAVATDLPQRVPLGGDGARSATAGTGVDELLTRLAAAERARDEAVRRADALAAELEEARSRPAETFGMRADKVLRLADHDAHQRRRAAEQEAEELRERARAEAERITTEARAEAERVTADAAAEVERLRAAGAAARRDGELLADTAASMHAHVSGLRSTVRDEVARLHALLGDELGRLDEPARLPGDRARRDDTTTAPAGGAHTLREPADPGPATGDLPEVSLPAQRAGGAPGDDRDAAADGREADVAGAEGTAPPARTTGDAAEA